MSTYKDYTPEQLEENLSNFLVDSWSYSKLTQFSRNEKAFEMQYIYGQYGRSSATTISGQAYHEALKQYFISKREGKTLDLPSLEKIAYDYINDVPANYWKLQKTTPTIEEAQIKAIKTTTALLQNFLGELSTYE